VIPSFQRPFRGKTNEDLSNAILTEDIKIPPSSSEASLVSDDCISVLKGVRKIIVRVGLRSCEGYGVSLHHTEMGPYLILVFSFLVGVWCLLALQIRRCRQLLNRSTSKRLGCGPNGFEELKAHPFFKGVEWLKLEKKDATSPFVPDVSFNFFACVLLHACC
jgi:hypothetical protein